MKDGERDKNYLLKQVRKEKCKEPEAIGRLVETGKISIPARTCPKCERSTLNGSIYVIGIKRGRGDWCATGAGRRGERPRGAN